MSTKVDAKMLEDLLRDPQRHLRARAELRKDLDENPGTITYLRWQSRLPSPSSATPIVIVSSFTIETIAPFLDVEAYVSGWRIAPTFHQYGQWERALLDPSLISKEAKACILLLHRQALVADKVTVEQALANLQELIGQFRKTHVIPIIIGLLAELPDVDDIAFGLNTPSMRVDDLANLNAGIRKISKEIDGVFVLDIPMLAAYVGATWYDRAGYHARLSVVSHQGLPVLARGIARLVACLLRPRRKVLVMDLDNTLWGGIVGEDEAEGVALGEGWPGAAYIEFQKTIKALRDSGIVLAINSKNNEEDARAVFDSRAEMILRWNDFASRKINWNNKVENLKEIAAELNVGLDSLVFVDDSPAECALVRDVLPMIEVVELGSDPSLFAKNLLASQAFDTLAISREDKMRNESYAVESKRKSLQISTADYESFLRRLNLRLRIDPASGGMADRLYQLINKTNQFNLNLRRISFDEVRKLIVERARLYAISLSDQFGDYGIVGSVQLSRTDENLEIVGLAISCRVLGRRVEEAVLAFCCEQARLDGLAQLSAVHVEGARNQQIQDVFRRCEFNEVCLSDSCRKYTMDLRSHNVTWPDCFIGQCS